MRLGKNCSDLEHLTSSLTVRGCDNGSVNVLESTGLEELVSSICEVVSHSGHSTNQVSTGTQVSDFSQVLLGVMFLGQRVCLGITLSKNLCEMSTIYLANLELEELALGGTLNQSALDLEGCTDVSLNEFFVAFNFFGDNSL